MEGNKSVHQRDGASKEAEEGVAGGSALARCSSFKQGDRVIVVGRDAEGAKTFRTATIATVRGNSAPWSWWGQPWGARRCSVALLALAVCMLREKKVLPVMRRFDFVAFHRVYLLVPIKGVGSLERKVMFEGPTPCTQIRGPAPPAGLRIASLSGINRSRLHRDRWFMAQYNRDSLSRHSVTQEKLTRS